MINRRSFCVKYAEICKISLYIIRIIGNGMYILVISSSPRPFGYNKRISFFEELKKELKMKTYTLTWKHGSYYGSTLSRMRFDSLCVFWNYDMQNDKLMQFLCVMSFSMFANSSLRLIKCGKLVARQATYQGV